MGLDRGSGPEPTIPLCGPIRLNWYNKKAEARLNAMNEVVGARDLGWKILAAEITVQICADVLSNTDEEPDEADTDTLVGQVFARLKKVSGKPYAEIMELTRHDDSLSELRNIVARLCRVVG